MEGWNVVSDESERETVVALLEQPFYQSLLRDLQGANDEINYPVVYINGFLRWKAEPWVETISNYDTEKELAGKRNMCVIDLNMLSVASQIGGPKLIEAQKALYKRMGTSLTCYSEIFYHHAG
jgi:hypothetical protein